MEILQSPTLVQFFPSEKPTNTNTFIHLDLAYQYQYHPCYHPFQCFLPWLLLSLWHICIIGFILSQSYMLNSLLNFALIDSQVSLFCYYGFTCANLYRSKQLQETVMEMMIICRFWFVNQKTNNHID